MKLINCKNIDRNYYKIVFLILLLFAISANIAWLHPGEQAAKTNPKIPIYWQYDCDASVDFLSGAFFPQYFKVDPQRINRPANPFFAKVFGESIGLMAWPVFKMGVLAKTFLGFVAWKFIFFLGGAVLLYKSVKEWLGERTALLSVAVVFFHPHSILWAATFGTLEAEFITPVIIIFLFSDWLKSRSLRRNFVYSIVAGVLLLIKENYAVYLAILSFGLLKRRFKETGVSVAGFLVPQTLWFLTLKILHISYYNLQTETYHQGTWIFSDLLFRHPVDILQTITASINGWLGMYAGYYSVFLIAAVFAFAYEPVRKKFNHPAIQFFGIFFFFSWLQTLAVNLYDSPFRVSDAAFLIFPLGVFTFLQIIDKYLSKQRAKKIIIAGMVIYVLSGLISLIKLPWVHPYAQPNALESKQERIDKFEQGIIYQK